MLCCVVFQQSGTPIIHPYADEGFPDETLPRILQPLLLRANGGGYPWSVYRIGYAQLYVCALTNRTEHSIIVHTLMHTAITTWH